MRTIWVRTDDEMAEAMSASGDRLIIVEGSEVSGDRVFTNVGPGAIYMQAASPRTVIVTQATVGESLRVQLPDEV